MTAYCTACGAALLDVGRYCTSCGHRRADAPEVEAPPPAGQQPGPARYPLYVDPDPSHEPTHEPTHQSMHPPPGSWHQPTETALPPVPAAPPPPPVPGSRPRRRGPLLALVLLLVAVLAVGGAAWLGGRDGGPTPAAPEAGGDAEPRSLLDLAEAFAPAQDDDSVDIATGETTTYAPANLLDDDPATAWRVAGAAVGTELVMRFDSPVTLTTVGLVNGYAKTSVSDGTTYDLYTGGRRVTAVTWMLGDAPPVRQELSQTREPQVIDVGAVTTDTVRLRIESVTEPGSGPAARDTTAISDVVLEGLRE